MTIAFRPALFPQDQTLLAEIFVASIMELGEDWYDEDELTAWASAAEDVADFGQRLSPLLTLIATNDGEPAGFVSLKDNTKIHMLYVAPEHAGQGIGTALVKAVETIATHRGAKSLEVDASDMAKRLFEKLGYVAQRRNTVNISGVWLGNTTMTKETGEAKAGRA
jgi:putative acetyltransferase